MVKPWYEMLLSFENNFCRETGLAVTLDVIITTFKDDSNATNANGF